MCAALRHLKGFNPPHKKRRFSSESSGVIYDLKTFVLTALRKRALVTYGTLRNWDTLGLVHDRTGKLWDWYTVEEARIGPTPHIHPTRSSETAKTQERREQNAQTTHIEELN